tara:strand:+ start:8196 stop:10628 length:2433 start_codon:yes stop_codon:yes gene_type:complete
MPEESNKKAKNVVRKKYSSPSKNFLDWVNGLGIEKTFLGRWLHFLDEHLNFRYVSYIFIFCFALSLVIHFEQKPFNVSYSAGDVVSVDIKSPYEFEFTDHIETAKNKQAAEDKVAPVFDFNSQVYEELFAKLDNAFRVMRSRLMGKDIPSAEADFDVFAATFMKDNKEEFQNLLGVRKISDSHFIWLVKKRFSSFYLNYIYRLLEPISQSYVIPNIRPLRRSTVDSLLIRIIDRPKDKKPVAVDEKQVKASDIIDIALAKSIVLKSKSKIFEKMSPADRLKLKGFSASLIVANLSHNIEETALRRQQARDSLPHVLIKVDKNQLILPEGTSVNDKQIMVLNEIRKISTQKDKDFISFVSALFLTILALVLLSFLRRFTINKVVIDNKDMAVMGLITFISVFLTKLISVLTDVSIFRDLGFAAPEKFFLYMAPVAAATMLVALLFTRGEVVWLFSVFLAAALSLLVKFDFTYFMFVVLGSVAAARAVFNSKNRNGVYLAGLRVGAINFLTIASLTWLTSKDPSLNEILWYAPAGFLSGIFSALVVMMLVPLFESVFNYTTDVRLMELSNLNHPLLKEMLLKAPGTYHHSVIVGTMAESAAEVIGANPLLSKVGAFYHDIGKMQHAEYFAENQRKGFNPHDNISPHMSKTILVAHVKDGAEMGMRYKLGKPIIDIILQHHGTTLMSYFYNKAKESEDDIHKVSEEEFRYPGPKPQFKEAGLVMLADSIEAAARSLEEPTASRLQNIVKNIIKNKFLDGQLEECNITLRDLSTIERVYERILLTIYHQRVEYPKEMGGVDVDKSTDLVSVKGE